MNFSENFIKAGFNNRECTNKTIQKQEYCISRKIILERHDMRFLIKLSLLGFTFQNIEIGHDIVFE